MLIIFKVAFVNVNKLIEPEPSRPQCYESIVTLEAGTIYLELAFAVVVAVAVEVKGEKEEKAE